MIELKDVRKSFNGVEVLKGISTKFETGKVNLVIGSSGHGKSVMMKCMVGLLSPTSGNVFYDDRDFTNLEYFELREVRKEIGMLFQGTALFDSLTVEENVEFTLKMFTKMTKAERRDRVNFCLEQVNMAGINDKFPAEISGGMQKRVGIARAIALDIKYLFCDEPNSGLDPVTSRLIDELLQSITEEFNITTIINTHDMKSVFDIGDDVIFIYEGTNGWSGKVKDIKHSDNETLKRFIQASQFD
ncbi:ATP-binding cassette domain-containing protein [Bacteroidia bacterium]|jgi:phospholipid/cholesterol/gamma-HCH transport system ATP-binding protein|nr:ATP-binding cassette domain-containing protein [Bacteroidia bacterium]|tara:strand:+ start:288 stop:1019 length:732 start_codon:yes stop_codon:yes gene_type:complete